MLTQFEEYLTLDNIYLWTNFGVLPFWLMLIFLPGSKFTQFLVNSIITPLILSAAYVYVAYQAILLEESFLEIFKIYVSLSDLYAVFSTESFLLIFWLHFLAINLFLGSWVSRESLKYQIPRVIRLASLILIYFTGPIGLIFYWLFRIFFAKKLRLHD
jgi:hypothetical protein